MFREASDAWNTHGPDGVRIPRLTSGKIGACARDMVGECQRCGTVVCRVSWTGTEPDNQELMAVVQNCIMKAPSPIALKSRHRRICRTCLKAPLEPHTRIPQSIEEGDEAAPLAEDSYVLFSNHATLKLLTYAYQAFTQAISVPRPLHLRRTSLDLPALRRHSAHPRHVLYARLDLALTLQHSSSRPWYRHRRRRRRRTMRP